MLVAGILIVDATYIEGQNSMGSLRKCGTEAHADAKAAQVLLMRVHDKRFHRYSTMSDIKQHHREDHQAYLARQ